MTKLNPAANRIHETLQLRILLASLIACTFFGCGNPNRAKIVGTWEIDQADRVMDRINEEDLSDQDELENDSPKMMIRFLSNGQLKTVTNMGTIKQQKIGTWNLVSANEAANELIVSCEIQSQKSEHEINIIDGNTIKLVPPNMAGTTTKLKFKRKTQ
ncbi:MAG: hypothetical protein AB8B55_17890 [Mariniblastus sp.]